MDAKTNGRTSAFPQEGCSNGMSLREWFAGQALAGLCAGHLGYDPATCAAHAKVMADALLAELAKE